MSGSDSSDFFEACRKGDAFIVEKFVKPSTFGKKVNLDKQNEAGDTPLSIAASLGYSLVVDTLLTSKADPCVPNSDGNNPVLLAALTGNLSCLKRMVKAKASSVNTINTVNSATPLMSAAWSGHKDSVQFLMESGADINMKNESGWTALHGACWHGHKDCVQILLDAKADPAEKNSDGWACVHGAAYNGRLEVLQMLHAKGCDMNLENAEGWTALMCAASSGKDACVSWLLKDGGASVSHCNKDLWTSLHAACWGGHLSSVEILVGHCADMGAKNCNGCTPAHLAAFHDHIDIVSLFVQLLCQEDLENTDEDGSTLLIAAAGRGSKKSVQLLLSRGVAINAANHVGDTALIAACTGSHLDVAKILLRYKADPRIKNNFGKDAATVATSTDILGILLVAEDELKDSEKHEKSLPTETSKAPKVGTMETLAEDATEDIPLLSPSTAPPPSLLSPLTTSASSLTELQSPAATSRISPVPTRPFATGTQSQSDSGTPTIAIPQPTRPTTPHAPISAAPTPQARPQPVRPQALTPSTPQMPHSPMLPLPSPANNSDDEVYAAMSRSELVNALKESTARAERAEAVIKLLHAEIDKLRSAHL